MTEIAPGLITVVAHLGVNHTDANGRFSHTGITYEVADIPMAAIQSDTIVENASEELVSSILFRQFNGFTKEAFIFFGQLIRIVHDGGDEVQSGRIHNRIDHSDLAAPLGKS